MTRRLPARLRPARPLSALTLAAAVLHLPSPAWSSPARASIGSAFFESLGERAAEAFDELDGALPSKRRKPPKQQTPPAAPAPMAAPPLVTRPPPAKSAPTSPAPSPASVAAPAPSTTPTPPAVEAPPAFGLRILQLVNEARARGGDCGGTLFDPAPGLTSNGLLDRAAQGHAEAMARQQFFDHTDPQGRTPRQRITATGYAGTAWGENIAAGQPTAEAVVQAWLKSPGHCKNIHSPMFDQLGVGALVGVSGAYKTYWVQNFGKAK